MKQKYFKLAMAILLIASCYTIYGATASVSITNPQDSAILSGTVDITAVIDGRAKKRVAFFIDNVQVGVDKKSPYVFTWDTTLYSEGIHSVKVQAMDRHQQTIEDIITVTVKNNQPPFGEMDTPINNSTVYGVIPVTGWALDDVEVVSVSIYRESAQGLIKIWDASFVEGIRPDIAQEYPGYPNNERAAWAYSLMTGLFPDKGNSTYTIHAIATDSHGAETTLGTRTIHCDNANSTKPFGSFFRPDHGATASGNYMNTGWALTPQPNTIPYDGSTITAFLDGVNIGHPFYNIWREEIAHAFQGYNNSEGAGGYIYIDTTQYQNGIHTLSWIVVDDAGNSGSVGTRYFKIENPVPVSMQNSMEASITPGDLGKLELNITDPVAVRKGHNEKSAITNSYPGENGAITIEIEEMERLVLHFFDNGIYTANSLESGELAGLPVGSSVDKEKGIFYWQPGPGAVGAFSTVFVTGKDTSTFKKYPVIITIKPKLPEK
jgi:hypothetical protein